MNSRKYDLEDRTLVFSQKVIDLVKHIRITNYNKAIIDQLIRSGTSIGANYREANEAESRKDFKNKIKIARSEAKETQYWLKLLKSSDSLDEALIEHLIKESLELTLILSSIYSK
jgi:four helix bundle protein